MRYKMRTFSKRDTNVLKGIAIMLLLFHHIFYDTWASGIPSPQIFLLPSVTSILTRYGACSIFIFALLSGYGIEASMEKDMSMSRVTVRRETVLLGTFVPVYFAGLIAVMIGAHSITAPLINAYGENKLQILINMILDMFGLSNLAGLNMLNPTWWYMGAAHLIIFCTPLAVILFFALDKYRASGGLLIFLWLYAAFHNEGFIYIFQYCMVAAVTGAYLRKERVIEKISRCFASVKGRILEAVLIVLSILVYHAAYQYGGLNTYFITAVFAPVSMVVVYDYVSKIRYLRTVLEVLGENSAIMYMSHTFFLDIEPLRAFSYQFKYAFMTYLFILIADLGFSVGLKKLMDVSGYNKLLSRIQRLEPSAS